MDKYELKATLSIALLYVVRMLGLFMVLPVLPLVLDDSLLLAGIALGAYGLSQALLQIPLGLLSDKYGRKPVIFCGLSIFILGSLVAACSENIYFIILGRFLQGCGAIASTLLALLSDVTRASNRSKAMAIVGISIGASFSIALIAGPLINRYFGLSGIFLATAVAGALGIVLLIYVIPTPEISIFNPQSQFSQSRLTEVLGSGKLLRTIFGIFCLHYLLVASFMAFPRLMQATGTIATDSYHLIYLGILTITFALMAPFMWLSDKPSFAKPLLLVMIGMFIAACFTLAQYQGYYAVLGGMILFFMAFNLLEVILPSLVSKIAPPGARGTAMGIYSTAQFAGAFIGGVIGGYLLHIGSMIQLLYANIVLCIIWLLASMSLPKIGNITTLAWPFTAGSQAQRNELKDALLAVSGVLELAFVDSVAYLKVDNDLLDENQLAGIKRTHGDTFLSASEIHG